MDTALGLVNLSISASADDDRDTLLALAAAHDCHITKIITIDDETFMPTTLITHTAHALRASVILAPDLAHFGTATRALALNCMLIAPRSVIPRVSGWTP